MREHSARPAPDDVATATIPTVTGAGPLTPREGVVAELVARGATNKQTAQMLFVSPKTVEFHLSSVFRKLGITSRSQLAWLVAARRLDRDRIGPPPSNSPRAALSIAGAP